MLAANRLEEAESLLRHAIEDPKSSFEFRLCYLEVLAKQNKCEMALKFIECYPDPLCNEILFNLLDKLLRDRCHYAVDFILGVKCSEKFQKNIFTFWRAASLYCREDCARSIDLFQVTAVEGAVAWNSGNRSPYIQGYMVPGITLPKVQEIRRAEQELDESPNLEWIFSSLKQQDHPPITVISGNDRYVLRFVDQALEGLHASGFPPVCHIHLIGGSPAVYECIQALHVRFPGSIVGITVEPVPAHNALTYFASARFLIARSLLQHYQADLIITDIDSAFTPAVTGLKGVMESFDLGFYRQSPRSLPWIDCLCGLVYVRRTNGAHRFLRGFGSILRQKINDGAPWMVDQGCLYSSFVYFSEVGVQICDFGEKTGHPINHVLASLCTYEEKKAIRGG